jgi:hypothetical protein
MPSHQSLHKKYGGDVGESIRVHYTPPARPGPRLSREPGSRHYVKNWVCNGRDRFSVMGNASLGFGNGRDRFSLMGNASLTDQVLQISQEVNG